MSALSNRLDVNEHVCATVGCKAASVPDRRGGRVARDSQPTRSDSGDPRCISIESLTRQPSLLPPRPTHFQTSVWQGPPCHGGLDDGAESRGQTARASSCKQTENDQDGQTRGRGGRRGDGKVVVVVVGGLAPTHSASLCCRIVAFFATVILGMNHGVTHILPPGRCAFEPIPLFDVHSLQARASQRPVYRDVLVFFLSIFFKLHAVVCASVLPSVCLFTSPIKPVYRCGVGSMALIRPPVSQTSR